MDAEGNSQCCTGYAVRRLFRPGHYLPHCPVYRSSFQTAARLFRRWHPQRCSRRSCRLCLDSSDLRRLEEIVKRAEIGGYPGCPEYLESETDWWAGGRWRALAFLEATCAVRRSKNRWPARSQGNKRAIPTPAQRAWLDRN